MVGAITGGNVGRNFGLGWLLLGAVLGFAIVVASVFIFTIPYVYLQVRMELRSAVPRKWSPSLCWSNLYFLVVAACVLLAGIGSWWAVRVIGGAAAGAEAASWNSVISKAKSEARKLGGNTIVVTQWGYQPVTGYATSDGMTVPVAANRKLLVAAVYRTPNKK